MYHLVNVVACDDESLKDVGTLLCLLKVELGATDGHVVTMLHEVLHTLLKCEEARTSVDEGDAVD